MLQDVRGAWGIPKWGDPGNGIADDRAGPARLRPLSRRPADASKARQQVFAQIMRQEPCRGKYQGAKKRPAGVEPGALEMSEACEGRYARASAGLLRLRSGSNLDLIPEVFDGGLELRVLEPGALLFRRQVAAGNDLLLVKGILQLVEFFPS
jgi:hypothetical protein